MGVGYVTMWVFAHMGQVRLGKWMKERVLLVLICRKLYVLSIFLVLAEMGSQVFLERGKRG